MKTATMIRKTKSVLLLCLLGAIRYVSCLSQGCNTRRALLNRVPAAVAAFGMTFLLNFDHGSKYGCTICQVGPQSASAYEMREIGDSDRSALTEAMNRQAYETNNRLDRSGFKLDSPEEEKARLSYALSSFSYDSKPLTKQSVSVWLLDTTLRKDYVKELC